MSLREYIHDSPEAKARRELFERGLKIRKRLGPVLLSTLSMTGDEFCAYLRVMGQLHGFRATSEPSLSDIEIFEDKLTTLGHPLN